MLDPATALSFSIHENKGVYALLLGSGVSRAAQVPTGWEITLDLIRRVALLKGIEEQADWAAWYRNEYGKEPNYSELLDALATSPEERRAILHSYIEPTKDDLEAGRKVPTAAHKAIAKLVRDGFIRVILTTNFDRLIENALREEGVEPTVIKSDDDLKGAVPYVHSRCFLVKLHGDYLDTRIKNTEPELATYSAEMNALIDRIVDEHGLVVCGWSAEWDGALCAALARAPTRRFTTFWAVRGAPSARASDLISHRGAKVVKISDADLFYTRLEQQVSMQAEMRRPHPQSTALIVASAKKFLSRSEFRIQLGELIGNTHNQLLQRVADGDFGTQGQWSVEEFRSRIRRYEAASEPLVRLFGVLGRWGDGQELPLATEILRDLAREDPIGGLTVWINLRAYPAVLALYAYGLGACKAGRHAVVFKWLMTPLHINRGELEPAVTRLMLSAWEGGQKEIWQKLEGLERRKAPLSDHLHGQFGQWIKDYLFSKREYDETFATFEILADLAFLTARASKEDLQTALQSDDQRNFIWVPVGRSLLLSEMRDRTFAELERLEIKQSILKAGFGGGDDQWFTLALRNMRRFASKLSWM